MNNCYDCNVHRTRNGPPCIKNTEATVEITKELDALHMIHDELLTVAELLNKLANTCVSLAEGLEPEYMEPAS
jgi:hypothetical protein